MEDLFNLIEKYECVTIFGHIYPDGDCYGSEIGLREALRYYYPNKKIYAVGSGFSKRPIAFPAMDDIDDKTVSESLAIIVDLSTTDRLEDPRALNAKEIAKIDHHVFQQHFGTVEIVKEDYVSATLIIAELLLSRFESLPKSSAGPLLLGLITDSGRFLYPPIDEKTLTIASRLVSCGADFKEIYDSLYVVEEQSLRFKGYIFLNYQKDEAGIAYMVLPYDVLKKYGYDENSGAGYVNSLANISGMKAWVFFAESESGSVRVELRSSDFPVQPTAVKFGGGGHRCAAGCRLNKLEDYRELLDSLAESIRKGETL